MKNLNENKYVGLRNGVRHQKQSVLSANIFKTIQLFLFIFQFMDVLPDFYYSSEKEP